MSIVVLLIENDHRHAQAMVRAFAVAETGWQVAVVSSMAHAADEQVRQPPDIVLVAQNAVEGATHELLECFGHLPKMIILCHQAPLQAAQALCEGFDGVAMQDPEMNYARALPAQIRALLKSHSHSHSRKPARADAQTLLSRQHRLLQAITRAQAVFIVSSGPKAAFDALLEDFLDLTQSQFGLVGQVQRAQDGHPYLLAHSLSDISWDDASRQRYAQLAQNGIVFDNLDSLLGVPLVSGQPLISNDAANDPRSAGVPRGHPQLRTYLGVPIHAGGELVAMVGLANRAADYTQADIDFLRPLLNTVGQLELERRAAMVGF
mgnify:FL=1